MIVTLAPENVLLSDVKRMVGWELKFVLATRMLILILVSGRLRLALMVLRIC